MKKKTAMAAVLLLTGVIMYACGSSNDGGGTGSVSLYVTDDLGDYKQVNATLNDVQLVHTGTGLTCDLLDEPQNLDIANLHEVVQYVDTTDCPAGQYNRIHIEFEEAVGLVNNADTAAACLFDSYKDTGNANRPNVLTCSDGICTMNINGAVNVAVNTDNQFGLDFDLREFEVENFGTTECSVTMKVEPLNRNGFDDKMQTGYRTGFSGYVTELDTDGDSFILTTRRGDVFSVEYSDALYREEVQPDLDGLLDFAATNELLARIFTGNIEITGSEPVSAVGILVKLEGEVSSIADNGFDLTNVDKTIYITVDYTDAAAFDKVEGTLAENSWVETKLFGWTDEVYLAHEVEIEDAEEGETDD